MNPDNTLALVLTDSDHTGPLSFGYEVSYADGTTSQFEAPLTVEPGLQAAGWGTGDAIYMLETDANDDIVVEHGDNHRKVYVSGSEDALTIADIAALEDLDPSKITGKWLAANPDYGSDPDMALAEDAGNALWVALDRRRRGASSHWLLFERGSRRITSTCTTRMVRKVNRNCTRFTSPPTVKGIARCSATH